MQVGVDVKCLQTNFGGRCLSDFKDIAFTKHFYYKCISPNVDLFFMHVDGEMLRGW